MSKIVGTVITIPQYLSKDSVELVVQPGQPQEQKIMLKENRKYEIPLFQREIRWNTGNVNVLLSDLLHAPRFLGNIIISLRNDEFCEIIDGQQRTTVLCMIMECLKNKYGDEIALFDLCPLVNKSFPGLQSIFSAGFDKSRFSAEEWNNMMKGDVYKQFSNILKLWDALNSSEILCNRYQAQKLVDNLKESEFNVIASRATDENISIRYFLDVNLKGVQLDTEDIFKGYLFSQDSRDDTRVLWQDIKQRAIDFNMLKGGKEDKRYPLMKIYEHFFYCDLYTSKFEGQDFSSLKFGENFLSTTRFKTDGTTFFEGTHIIEIICNRTYLQTSLKRILRALDIMLDIVSSNNGPSDDFKQLFECEEKIDSVHISNCHIMLQKILLDKEVIPKVLALKYILSLFDGNAHKKQEYISVYSIFTAAVLFTVLAPKKESETFYGFVSSKTCVEDIDCWLMNYISSHNLTRGKLSAAYKCSELSFDDDITDQVRSKSLASILNYMTVKKVGDKEMLRVRNYKAVQTFLHDTEKYSVEHFIVGENGSLTVKTTKYDFQYIYPPQIKKYRNSLFNYIFIPRKINNSLGNNLILHKIQKLQPSIEDIECNYSKKFVEMISDNKYFCDYPTVQKIDEFATKEHVEEYLTKYFTQTFPDEFLAFAIDLVKTFKF